MAFISACQGSGAGAPAPLGEYPGSRPGSENCASWNPAASPLLDFNLTTKEAGRLREAYALAGDLRFDTRDSDTGSGSALSGIYERAIGHGCGKLVEYLDSRVHAVVSSTTRLPLLGSLTDPNVHALNAGALLWLLGLRRGSAIELSLDDTNVALDSSRAGLLWLGPAFSTRGRRVDRLATLVHEARHSDCVNGLGPDDLDKIHAGDFRAINPDCTYIHTACPEGHELEGVQACDSRPWGPYAIEALFARTLAQECPGCSEEDRQDAAIIAIDALYRVKDGPALFRGELGEPDMRSAGVRE